MSTPLDVAPTDPRELVLARLVAAPPAALFRCWTEPDLVKHWFTPPPWRTVGAELDVRPGGSSLVVMEGPDGTRVENRGVYLEVVRPERLAFTDAFTRAWVPAEKPFVAVTLAFEAAEGGTRYVARARHWTREDRERHEAMGFHAGWGVAADQMEAVAATLA